MKNETQDPLLYRKFILEEFNQLTIISSNIK